MNKSKYFSDNGYVLVKNFLSEDAANIARTYTQMQNKFNHSEVADDVVTNTQSVHGDYLMESIMLNVWEKIESITNLKLLPTYTFYRVYKDGDILEAHKDRPACEVSCTLNLGQSDPWYFYADSGKFLLDPGDAVIYKGIDVEHWRERFTGDYYSQVFLHYINANGDHKDQFMDGRGDIYGIFE